MKLERAVFDQVTRLLVSSLALQAYRLNRVSAELARKAADDVGTQTGQLNFYEDNAL